MDAGKTDRTARNREIRTGALAGAISGMTGVDFVGREASWITTEPGDCIIFDPRVLHTGSKFHGEKFAIFVAYGVENSHFRNHWSYYRHLRKDLGYGTLDPELVDRLRRANLFAAEPEPSPTAKNAWIPSAAYKFVAKKFT